MQQFDSCCLLPIAAFVLSYKGTADKNHFLPLMFGMLQAGTLMYLRIVSSYSNQPLSNSPALF